MKVKQLIRALTFMPSEAEVYIDNAGDNEKIITVTREQQALHVTKITDPIGSGVSYSVILNYRGSTDGLLSFQ